jgi:DNA-binding transcriptional regulator YiaG
MTKEQIIKQRQAFNMTPTQFGIALGLTDKGARITVWRWENNKTAPSPQTVMLMKTLKPRKLNTK